MRVSPFTPIPSSFDEEALTRARMRHLRQRAAACAGERLSHEIPVVLRPATFGLDLEDGGAAAGCTVERGGRAACRRSSYRVFMLGFLPGFPYMGTVHESIAVPRRATPRPVVPAGSVGIAGRQTGIYPVDSPGGWQIVGRTPVRLFDPAAAEPPLVRAWRSRAIRVRSTAAEFEALAAALEHCIECDAHPAAGNADDRAGSRTARLSGGRGARLPAPWIPGRRGSRTGWSGTPTARRCWKSRWSVRELTSNARHGLPWRVPISRYESARSPGECRLRVVCRRDVTSRSGRAEWRPRLSRGRRRHRDAAGARQRVHASACAHGRVRWTGAEGRGSRPARSARPSAAAAALSLELAALTRRSETTLHVVPGAASDDIAADAFATLCRERFTLSARFGSHGLSAFELRAMAVRQRFAAVIADGDGSDSTTAGRYANSADGGSPDDWRIFADCACCSAPTGLRRVSSRQVIASRSPPRPSRRPPRPMPRWKPG